jgi:hypothetical protein
MHGMAAVLGDTMRDERKTTHGYTCWSGVCHMGPPVGARARSGLELRQ